MKKTVQRNAAIAAMYADWRKQDAQLPASSTARRGYAALAAYFDVSIHVARHAVAYCR